MESKIISNIEIEGIYIFNKKLTILIFENYNFKMIIPKTQGITPEGR